MNLYTPFFWKFKIYTDCQNNNLTKKIINTHYVLDSGTGRVRMGKDDSFLRKAHENHER